jgi:hypothetical protein
MGQLIDTSSDNVDRYDGAKAPVPQPLLSICGLVGIIVL